jgi:ribose transport system substrate-binding protein
LGVTIHARGTINDMDSKGQKFLLDHTINKYKCYGLVIAPSDVSRNKDITRLLAEGIPSVYIDRDTGGDRLAVIKTDNYAAGVLAAKNLHQALRGRNRVVLFRLKKGVTSTDDRELGFLH